MRHGALRLLLLEIDRKQIWHADHSGSAGCLNSDDSPGLFQGRCSDARLRSAASRGAVPCQSQSQRPLRFICHSALQRCSCCNHALVVAVTVLQAWSAAVQQHSAASPAAAPCQSPPLRPLKILIRQCSSNLMTGLLRSLWICRRRGPQAALRHSAAFPAAAPCRSPPQRPWMALRCRHRRGVPISRVPWPGSRGG